MIDPVSRALLMVAGDNAITGQDVFYAGTRTGTGAAATITTGLNMASEGGLFMSRSYTAAAGNYFFDTERGATNYFRTELANANATDAQSVTAFNDGDIDIGTSSLINTSTTAYLDIAIRKAPEFFTMVSYTGNATNRTVAHDLGVAPELLIVKNENSASNWTVWCVGLTGAEYLFLNTTADKASSGGVWNSTVPTSTAFSVGVSTNTNGNTNGLTAYLFASLAGVSKLGTYTGNGTSVSVTTDFEPRFVLIKRLNAAGDWWYANSALGIVAGNDPALRLNSASAQTTTLDWLDTSSTSFTVNETATIAANTLGGTYFYMAIA